MTMSREKRKEFGEAIKPIKLQHIYTIELVDHTTGDVVESIASVPKHKVTDCINEMVDNISERVGLTICKEVYIE
jgi:hypothetical protein